MQKPFTAPVKPSNSRIPSTPPICRSKFKDVQPRSELQYGSIRADGVARRYILRLCSLYNWLRFEIPHPIFLRERHEKSKLSTVESAEYVKKNSAFSATLAVPFFVFILGGWGHQLPAPDSRLSQLSTLSKILVTPPNLAGQLRYSSRTLLRVYRSSWIPYPE